MSFRSLTPRFSVSPQLSIADLDKAAADGFSVIICARPDGEQDGQIPAAMIKRAAHDRGLSFYNIPVPSGSIPDEAAVEQMRETLAATSGPVLAYCQGGNRAARLWALAQAGEVPSEAILAAGEHAGIDLSLLAPFLPTTVQAPPIVSRKPDYHFNIVIVGGGAAGLATAASILRRRRSASVAIVEPSSNHFYQPGWTMVGGGIFTPEQTKRSEETLIPSGATWLRQTVTRFLPNRQEVVLDDDTSLSYDVLVVATGLTLDWAAIPGLEKTLGRNGVTSNYRYDLAPYTWRLVQALKHGTALFTQPPMPIKCAGAPQKAMYLACDAWRRRGVLSDMTVAFDTATPALFGVAPFVPALMSYIERYGIDLHLRSKLVAVDGEQRVATFERTTAEGITTRVARDFDMLHVVPPQIAPSVVSTSALAGADGFVAVDPATLRHTSFSNVFALGDVAGTSNAKTAAAVRKQAPVVAVNVLAALDGKAPVATYDGYGACPLTVERGRIVLAEFGYGGRLEPTLPLWLLRGTEPTRLAWFLKEKIMPPLYWNAMLRGHELMVAPRITQGA